MQKPQVLNLTKISPTVYDIHYAVKSSLMTLREVGFVTGL
jgi:hypothetical protein